MFLYDQIIALNLGVAVVMIAKVRNVFSFTSLLLVAISNVLCLLFGEVRSIFRV